MHRIVFAAVLALLGSRASTHAAALASTAVPAGSPAEERPSVGDLRRSGTVNLEITCSPEVRPDFQTATALLHSFFYDEARLRYEDIARRDPACAMAWWGVAMTSYHPLWAPPTPEELAEGTRAAAKARALGGRTDLERGLIASIDAYFRSGDVVPDTGPAAQSCHGPRAHGARSDAFRASLQELHEKLPDNLEVAAFYALSLIGTAPPTDKTYARQIAAAALLEPLWARNPDHPGLPHYIIHAYDYPTLASRALEAARRYGAIAPWVPHALHMPSHIYTRLGMWRESMEANRASAAASREYTGRRYDGATWYDELHALDYLAFAYLQTGQDGRAREVLQTVSDVKRFHQPNFAAAYALGAIPARYALERRRWKDAAALTVLHPDVVRPFPFAVAHTEFARAVGAARSGQPEVARQALGRLAELRDSLKEPKFQWWIDQVEIQRLAGAGWLARAEGRDEEAVKLLREAAALEDRAGTHPVTPGQILPAHEQLGDLLMELGRPAEALAEYETSLQAFPNRYNGHQGAARAASKAGRHDVARSHYESLLRLGGEGDRREEIAEARKETIR